MDGQEFRKLLRANDNLGIVGLVLLDNDARQDAVRLAKEEMTKGRGQEPDAKQATRAQLVSALEQIAAAPHLTQKAAIAAVTLEPQKPSGTAKLGGADLVVA